MSREESEGKSSQSNDESTTEPSASQGNVKEESNFPEATRLKSKNKFTNNLSEEVKVTVAEQIIAFLGLMRYSPHPLAPSPKSGRGRGEGHNYENYHNIRREDTRSKIAGKFLWILIGTYCLSFLTMIGVLAMPFFVQSNQELRNDSYSYTKDIISILITTQTGLVGSIMGFYFGSSSDSK